VRAFVTGATGFVGRALLRELAAEGHEIVGYCRDLARTKRLAALPVRWIVGKLDEPNEMARAMEGCDVAFHVAALITYDPRRRAEIHETNVLGTRAVVAAALAARVKRLVHTSSIAACAHTNDGRPLDESVPWNSQHLRIDYFDTKHLAEEEVRGGVASGLDAVIVNPGSIFGPESEGNSEAFLLDLARGKVPVAPRTGTTCVGVRDVAKGHVAAWKRGRRGERYVLGGENLPWPKLFAIAAEALGVKPPRITLSPAWLRAAAIPLDGISKVGFRLDKVSGPALRALGVCLYFDGAKAARELGYSPAPMREVLRETAEDLRRRGLIGASSPRRPPSAP
jgi:dihydroflavonol-4-reductase